MPPRAGRRVQAALQARPAALFLTEVTDVYEMEGGC